jgi:hypothetical protein
MKRQFRIFLLFYILIAIVPACNKWSIDTNWKSDGYRLIAIDTRSQMCLIYEKDNSALIGPTIFAVGSNKKYIVIKQHPETDQVTDNFDRSVTNYFIVERRGGSFDHRQAGVRGPLKKEAFEKLAVSLSLPEFSKTFDDLK